MIKIVVGIALVAIAVQATLYYTYMGEGPAPCSSSYFHHKGKCGPSKHGFLRCQYGLSCSQSGYCGTGSRYTNNAICPKETRSNPNKMVYKKSPDEKNWWDKMWESCYGMFSNGDDDCYYDADEQYAKDKRNGQYQSSTGNDYYQDSYAEPSESDAYAYQGKSY